MSIFIDNKYTRWYYAIIDSAKSRIITGYVEKHHIIPKSFGGSNSKDNLAILTAREHFLCHWLLTKMVESKRHKWQMLNALGCMLWRQNKGQTQRYKVSGRIYEKLKKQHNKAKSWAYSGKKNPMYGKKQTVASKEKMSVSQKERWATIELSEETREKLRSGRKYKGPNLDLRGKNNANYKPGVRDKMKATFIEKYGVTHGALIPVTCEHCGKKLGIANYKRHHGNRCKLKTN